MKNRSKGERWLATMLTRNEKFILSAWSYISSQQENTLSSISGQHCVWKPCFMNSRNSNVQIICESSDYTVVYIHINIHSKNTNSHGMYPSNKILKILEFEISQTKEGFPQTYRIENCTLCNVEEISKL